MPFFLPSNRMGEMKTVNLKRIFVCSYLVFIVALWMVLPPGDRDIQLEAGVGYLMLTSLVGWFLWHCFFEDHDNWKKK